MYFWRIDSLKRELVADAIGEAEALPYLLWLGGLTSLLGSLPEGEPNRWDVAGALLSAGLFVGATGYGFRCNGGSTGTKFFVRYLALSWVVSVRLLVLVGVPVLVVGIALEDFLYEPVPSETTPVLAGLLVALDCALYWRLTTHIRDVATASRTA